jgi:hypothetical protein
MKGSGAGKEIRTNNLPCPIARMLGGFARRRCRTFRIIDCGDRDKACRRAIYGLIPRLGKLALQH